MRNEKDRQEKYLNYFDQNQQNSQRNQSRRQQEQTQWFSPEDDEDMKLADDSFDEEDVLTPRRPGAKDAASPSSAALRRAFGAEPESLSAWLSFWLTLRW